MLLFFRHGGSVLLILICLFALFVFHVVVEKCHVDILVGFFLFGLDDAVYRLEEEQDVVEGVDFQFFEVAAAEVPLVFVALGKAAQGIALGVEIYNRDLLPPIHLFVDLIQLVNQFRKSLFLNSRSVFRCGWLIELLSRPIMLLTWHRIKAILRISVFFPREIIFIVT
jgi:hypothetical protein